MTHTPGPWSIVGDGSNEQLTLIVKPGDGIVSHIARLHPIWLADEHGGDVFANARLIAAAPPLLTAAQIAYTILADIRHHWEGRHTIEGQGALIALRDSIAQATGRDPQDVQDEFTNAKATS